MRVLALALVLLVGAAPALCADEPAVDAAADRARAELAAGRPDAAARILAPLADGHAAQLGALYLEALRRLQDFATGRAYVERVGDAADASTDLLIAVAQWEAEDGWVRRATERLEAALERAGDDGTTGDARLDAAALWSARARLARAQGDPAGTIGAAERAIDRGADPLDLAWLRGRAEFERGRPEVASALLEELVAARPGHQGARMTLARVARARGDRAAALAYLWWIVEHDPDHAAALGELGTLLVRDPATRDRGERALRRFGEIRDRRERIERLTRERREGRDGPTVRAELATLLRADGRPVLAAAVGAECALGSAGEIERARALVDLGRTREAVPLLAAGLRTDADRDDLRLELAEALLAGGDPAAARIVLARIGAGTTRAARPEDRVRRTLAAVECDAREGAGADRLLPPLVALVREVPGAVEPARAAVDVAIAFGESESLAAEFRTLRESAPSARAPLLGLAWLALESGTGDPATFVDDLRAVAESSPDAWICLAAEARARGDAEAAERAAREARRLRAVGPTRPPAGEEHGTEQGTEPGTEGAEEDRPPDDGVDSGSHPG